MNDRPFEVIGLRSVASRRAMNAHISECMQSATRCYDTMAYGLKSLRTGASWIVEACLRSGVKFRFLTVNPECEFLRLRDLEEHRENGTTKDEIIELRNWITVLQSVYPGQIEIRYADFLLTEFYCRIDNTLFVGPYQHGHDSQSTITFEYMSPCKAFKEYVSYFEKVWNDSHKI